ncbi:DNA polymerase III subunit delta' [Parasulfitobacter algicola]|uniref:DNA polymerase III subunit delta n=1 Tax=Parasulfitobacter algicola TaxID=2614809 RepID=A0ABX2IU65_9RHOB|nr:DNA polymerase III subunit delta' [Sulfitobacter algicola]NSX56457.1 DNA polymerase III subunit delta' [Sulfitobacter algicola]
MTDTTFLEADRIAGAPHPRETLHLIGQNDAQTSFLEAFNSGRLHHAWMITGPRGVGKATLAYRITRFLLTTPLNDDPGLFGDPAPVTTLDVPVDDPVSRRINANSEARLFVLRRGVDEKDKRDPKLKTVISVDDARKLKGFFSMSATDGGRRIVIIDAADEMNPQTANAILKLLEEPPENVFLLLICHQPSRLLPTIRSRCRELRLRALDPEQMDQAIGATGADVGSQTEYLAALSDGSVGEAIRMLNLDGLQSYQNIIDLLGTLPQLDRPKTLKLGESILGRAKEPQFDLLLRLMDIFLSRVAQTGIRGALPAEAANDEAALLTRLAPNVHAARAWAELQQTLSARARHGKAVNLDPASLILDMFLKIEQTAAKFAPIRG